MFVACMLSLLLGLLHSILYHDRQDHCANNVLFFLSLYIETPCKGHYEQQIFLLAHLKVPNTLRAHPTWQKHPF